MILESMLSCSCLFVTCGSCIHILISHSYNRYSKIFPRLVYACCGIAMIATRSFIVLVYKLFLKEYTFDPSMIQAEEKKNRDRYNVLDELLGTVSMASLIYSLYCHHGYRIVGACIVSSLSIIDVVKLHKTVATNPQQFQEIEMPQFHETSFRSKATTEPRCTIFVWVFVGGYFAYSVGNNYALVANYPYLLTNWALTPEGFYEGWTIRRTINDYMMAAYAICMTEALR